MNIEELKTEHERANKYWYSTRQNFDDLREARINQATKVIDEELAPQKSEVDRLWQKTLDAKKAVEDKLIELAREGNRNKYELGTKLQKTHKKWYGYGYRSTPSTIYGVLEVVTRETKFPDNTSSWGRPNPGSFIIRLCNKDGKPGKKFVKWTEYEANLWKPAEETA